ncbi:MAG: V4R domain-containing protein [Conexivisphaera sp.]
MVADRPIRIPTSWAEPGRDLVAISAEVAAGYVGMVYDAMRKAGFRVLSFMCSDGGPLLRCTGIVDATGAGRSPEDVATALSSMGGLANVRVIRDPVKGFAAAEGMILEAGGRRSIVMTSRALLGLLLGAREYLGDPVGSAFTYYAGLFSGRESAREFAAMFSRDQAIRLNVRTLESHGYASSIEVLAGESTYRFEVADLVECDLLRGHMTGRTSHWFRGVLAGLLSEVAGGEWDVEEVECVNDGSDRCVFSARRKFPGEAGKG